MPDVAEVVKASRRFYRDHDLRDWARAVPKGAVIPAGHDDALRQAEKAGFSEGFAFPPFALQMAGLEQLVDVTARRPAAGLPDTQQYSGEIFLADEWTRTANGRVLQRTDDLGPRTWGPYLLLFGPEAPTNAMGKTGRQIEELFHGRGWHGLTVPEYFVLQRWLCERYRDHRFVRTPQDDKPGHWLWLLDSTDGASCSVVAASARGINLQAAPANNRDARRGTVAGVLVPLASEGP